MPGGVLDAWALLAWLEDAPGAFAVHRRLRRAQARGYRLSLSVINAGEVFYRLVKAGDRKRADEFVGDLRQHTLPVELVSASNPRVWRAAGIKARYPVAYADAFAAALAQELKLPLITGDPDFLVLERHGECRVDWITPPPAKS